MFSSVTLKYVVASMDSLYVVLHSRNNGGRKEGKEGRKEGREGGRDEGREERRKEGSGEGRKQGRHLAFSPTNYFKK